MCDGLYQFRICGEIRLEIVQDAAAGTFCVEWGNLGRVELLYSDGSGGLGIELLGKAA